MKKGLTMHFHGKDYFFITTAGPKNKRLQTRVLRYFNAPDTKETRQFLENKLEKATLEYKAVSTIIKLANRNETIVTPYMDDQTVIVGFMNKNQDLLTSANLQKIRDAVETARNLYRAGVELHAYFSDGNDKTGNTNSVSIVPVLFCPGICKVEYGCAHVCYAFRDAIQYADNLKRLAENTAILLENPRQYWKEIKEHLQTVRYFRFHVSGEIVNAAYMKELVATALENPHCNILIFTKQDRIVNDYITKNGPLPENLHLLLSGWSNFTPENPHNLPETNVIRENTIVPDNWKICGGNCQYCYCRGVGCWTLKAGEILAFYEH